MLKKSWYIVLMKKEEKLALIEEVLTRGVSDFIDPEGSFKEKLIKKVNGQYEGEIIIKFGIDPTKADLHIGHAVALKKLKNFQDLGCKVILLIGDYTAQIGDPTGKDITRPEINFVEVEKNLKSFIDQAQIILETKDLDKYDWIRNSVWFLSVTDYDGSNVFEKSQNWQNGRIKWSQLKGGIETSSVFNLTYVLRHITISKLEERDMFKKRRESGGHVFMHEMMYPVFQGIDSHAIGKFYGSCDLEIGGSDQHFNMLMGRDVMKVSGWKDIQSVMTVEILEGLDGTEKMSKSLNNYIGINEKPSDMFGKVMTIRDELITKYFLLCTDYSREKISEIDEAIKNGQNPKNFKMELAKEIVRIYHGQKEAEKAEDFFIKTFEKKEIPDEVEEISFGEDKVADRLIKEKIVSSRTELIRLIKDGAITNLDKDKKVEREDDLKERGTYRIGKHRFIKVN